MVFKTYISKFNTIISGSKLNCGLNPISELVYGKDTVVSRSLFYFDHSVVKKLMGDRIFCDKSKMRHVLHITNAGSLDFTQLHDKETSSINGHEKIRATSFDIIFFLIPKPWDQGKGFDYSWNFLNVDLYDHSVVDQRRLVSTDGSNWFQRMNGLPWDEEGVFTNDHLAMEYDKWSSGEESIVIGRQHFDIGNESIELDITDTFNKFLDGELENNGIGMAFSPLLETMDTEYENYVGWLTNKTNLFFEPYVETRYSDYIDDSRANFVINKDNKLYLYCTIGDRLEALDTIPTVTVKDGDDNVIKDYDGNELKDIQAKEFSRGVYYIDLKLKKDDEQGIEEDVMLYDTWSNISYNGTPLDDVEMDFVIKGTSNFFNIGNSLEATNMTFTPYVSGIMEREKIRRGDVRKLVISAKPTYNSNTVQMLDFIDLRLYVMDGTREIDVISWDKVNKGFKEAFYMIDTNMLVPQRYYVDIRIRYGMNSIIHHDVLSFDIVSLLNNRYA